MIRCQNCGAPVQDEKCRYCALYHVSPKAKRLTDRQRRRQQIENVVRAIENSVGSIIRYEP